MKTPLLLFMAALLALPSAFGQIPGLAESHIEANVPEPKNFRAFLVRDLTTHLKRRFGDRITVDYEMLREGPTQSGVAYPKFYLWVTVTKEDQTKVEGAARVAAIEKKEFGVTSFSTRDEIAANPTSIEGVFPQVLLAKIRDRKSTRLNSSHSQISYAVFCLKKKKK